MRLRMSRPNSSVPSTWAAEGASSRSPTPILLGSTGASTPGTMAHNSAIARMTALSTTSWRGFRMAANRLNTPGAGGLRNAAMVSGRRTRPFVGNALERVLDVTRLDLLAIVVLRALAQVEDVGLLVRVLPL